MLIRIVDYVGNPGGGVRFVLETLRPLLRLHPEARFELVSHGAALDRYRALARAKNLDLKLVDMRPVNAWGTTARKIKGIRGSGRVFRLLGAGTVFHYVVPREGVVGCDVLWLPWIHRHRLAEPAPRRVVGSFHDAIFFKFEGLLPERDLADERETVRRWLASEASIIVSSNATVATMREVFGSSPDRFTTIPLSGEHAKETPPEQPAPHWGWAQKPFLMCPANTFPHKNHEVLIEGVASWGARYPLVLTGQGADLLPPNHGRAAVLRGLARARGLDIGESLIPLGYASDEAFFGLLSRAWALVMPTLAEGGGSFPVYEAMVHGVPVVCSDIPVIREQIERTGGDVLWFNPHDSQDLAHRLARLEKDYPYYKERAMRYANELYRRSWEDVANDYWRVLMPGEGGAGWRETP